VGTPDVWGLAVRVPTGQGGGYGDLLFASTGRGRLTRFTLLPSWSARARPLTTLLPYRTVAGPLLLSAEYDDEHTVTLSWAVLTGAWHAFAELSLREDELVEDEDALVSFDPVATCVPGLATYEWTRLLREPSYATARLSRARADRHERGPAAGGG
jgi:hypothetical protein